MNRNAYQKYNQVQIKTANKGKLIILLYQGSIKFMRKALQLLEEGDMEGKGNSLIRAQDIILELLYALDQEMLNKGDALALNLQRLYLYGYRRLVYANIHLDPEPIKEVIGLMGNLLQAWEEVVANQPDEEGGPGSSSKVALTG